MMLVSLNCLRPQARVGRCYLGFAAFMTCATVVFASTVVVAPIGKAVLLAFALASADLALSACWAVPLDIAPDHAGVVTGFMNTLGNLGGLVGPLIVGIAVQQWQSWTLPFYITAAVYASGALAWLVIDPTRALSAATLSTGDYEDASEAQRHREKQNEI